MIRRRQPLRSAAPLKRRTPLATRSAKRRAEDRLRTAVRQEVITRDGGCIMREHGGCIGPLDVDEVVSRGRGGSALDAANCQCLCRRHHEMKHNRVHFASIIGLWGERAEQLHVHRVLGDDYSLQDLHDMRAHALRAYNER